MARHIECWRKCAQGSAGTHLSAAQVCVVRKFEILALNAALPCFLSGIMINKAYNEDSKAHCVVPGLFSPQALFLCNDAYASCAQDFSLAPSEPQQGLERIGSQASKPWLRWHLP